MLADSCLRNIDSIIMTNGIPHTSPSSSPYYQHELPFDLMIHIRGGRLLQQRWCKLSVLECYVHAANTSFMLSYIQTHLLWSASQQFVTRLAGIWRIWSTNLPVIWDMVQMCCVQTHVTDCSCVMELMHSTSALLRQCLLWYRMTPLHNCCFSLRRARPYDDPHQATPIAKCSFAPQAATATLHSTTCVCTLSLESNVQPLYSA